jgi:phosphohistidine swiveling domain-containing protein
MMLFAFSDYMEKQHGVVSGGKGRILAKLFKLGYPVPDGFVILPEAFSEEEIKPKGWELVCRQYQQMINAAPETKDKSKTVAVRSSAIAEDSDSASYAGEFDSILNVDSEIGLKKAIDSVYRSRRNVRVLSYRQAQHIKTDDKMAVVVQRMVDADFSGVLFTADPLNNGKTLMKGNLVKGLGDKLMSGEASPFEFSFQRKDGDYKGPVFFKPYSKALFDMAVRLEKDLSGHQDIEWAVRGDQLFILQSRPITTLYDQNSDYYESPKGDYLWTRTNVGEAYGDVVTPLTWSLAERDDINAKKLPGKHPALGLISGRVYINMSIHIMMLKKFGLTYNSALKELSSVLGKVPQEIKVAPVDLSLKEICLTTIVNMISHLGYTIKEANALKRLIHKNMGLCNYSEYFIDNCTSAQQLIERFEEHARDIAQTFEYLIMNANRFVNCHARLKDLLAQHVDAEDSEILSSGFGGNAQLESLGPLIGISKLANGAMNRSTFDSLYGHRCTNELELSAPRNDEETGWIDNLIEQYRRNRNKVDALLEKQKIERERAWLRLDTSHPEKYQKCKQLYNQCAKWAQRRELIRSELVRMVSISRKYFLKIAELYSLGEDIFFLTIDEIKKLILDADHSVTVMIPQRKKAYKIYKNSPLPPPVIYGAYEPQLTSETKDIDIVKGFPGAVGIVEGRVRVIENFDKADALSEGEILVTSTTNVGWTPVFPIVSAIITDIGAPLSHAAIVARELGIPAVVGTGNATRKLSTGDLVRVDGAKGWVEMIGRG